MAKSSMHGATFVPGSILHKLFCPYCRYHWRHGTDEWNALTEMQRWDLVTRRLCND